MSKRSPDERSDIRGWTASAYRCAQTGYSLGFVNKVPLGEADGSPNFGWTLSEKYLRDIEP